MASVLAAQLSQIAANSTKSLNLKAQKAAHSQSLLFEPRIAASQSFDALYVLCHEGFQELCLLDSRFLEYQKTLFHMQSKERSRTQMTAEENAGLDTRLERFLGLVGGRLRLNLAIKCVEWLVRRFRIHEYNTSFLLSTFLPYHTLPIFTTLLSILPKEIPADYRFLHPYIRSLSTPPRHVIVYAATNNHTFTTTFNTYTILICKSGQSYASLISFWAGIMAEAVGGMLDKSKSGRMAVQSDKMQEVILRILPTLNQGLAMKRSSDLRLGCYMLLSVMASKGNLDDRVLMAMMEAVVLGWTPDTISAGLVCVSALAQRRGAKQVTRRLAKEMLKVENLITRLVQLSSKQRVDTITVGLCLTSIGRLNKSRSVKALSFVEQVVENNLMTDGQVAIVTKAMLLSAYKIDGNSATTEGVRRQLAHTLVRLGENAGHIGETIQLAINDSDIDIDELELELQMKFRPQLLSAADVAEPAKQHTNSTVKDDRPNIDQLLMNLETNDTNAVSFLTSTYSETFGQLSQAFTLFANAVEGLEKFDSSPILRRDEASRTPLYFTFYLRISSGPYPVLARKAALQLIAERLRNLEDSDTDYQALLPYLLVSLSDPASKVRRAASEAILAFLKVEVSASQSGKEHENISRWGADCLYGAIEDDFPLKWLAVGEVIRFVQDTLTPGLEECILDQSRIFHLFEKSLNGSKGSQQALIRTDLGRLPQNLRVSILSFLSSHAVCTPLYTVKLRLLKAINQIGRIASTNRTKALLPLLHKWSSIGLERAQMICDSEKIDLTEFDRQAVDIVVPSDKEGIHTLLSIIKDDAETSHPTLLKAATERLQGSWSQLKDDVRLHAAHTLLDISQQADEEGALASASKISATSFLRDVQLPSNLLLSFLSDLSLSTNLAEAGPAVKRRRTSRGAATASISTDMSATLRKATYILQLVDSSDPGKHPEILSSLFSALADLQHYKTLSGSDLSYLQTIILGSLLSIINEFKQGQSQKLDRSSIREDLLIDCVQKSTSPQVQNAALLLIAALANAAPELVLHSVMPIFTFISSSVLRQNDEYSAHVIDQTIRQVLPPLIKSLRREKGNPVIGAATILSSFVAAYEHVPVHRRDGLFTSLVSTLGSEDFLFALLAMLANKYGTSEIRIFAIGLTSHFGVECQLLTAIKYLDLVGDILKPRPSISKTLLVASESDNMEPSHVALNELSLLPSLLSEKHLTSEVGKLLERDDMDSARCRDIYSNLLEKVLALADVTKTNRALHDSCGDVLESLLALLSTGEFVKSVESLLDRANDALRRKVLRALEVRIDQETQSDALSRSAMLAFLPQLTAIIRESTSVPYKQTAVSCVDKIAEKYGKRDLEAVAAAAETIASEYCLGQDDERLRVNALLCLSSLVDILREGIVSVLPLAIPKALEYLASSAMQGSQQPMLHNAGYSFISSLIQYVPYMITGSYLERLLSISSTSAGADIDDTVAEGRSQCLQLLARQIDGKYLFAAMEKVWGQAVGQGLASIRQYVQILTLTIERNSKASITKYSSVLSKIFVNALDLRRRWSNEKVESLHDGSIDSIEASVNDAAIKMIYKLNDSTFRPIFANLVEWSNSGLPRGDTKGRILRLQSLYHFMTLFFNNLKSIVTSYATYILENVLEVLNNVDPKDEDAKTLWRSVLETLTRCFEHDQDDFWQAPSHFKAIAPVLNDQFRHASTLPLYDNLIPAIVELGSAADSQENHKFMNEGILRLLRSESSTVRLAAVKCEQALTERLGEEWLSMLPEMLPFISELQEDDDEVVEKETYRWIVRIEGVLGESLDSMLQ